jgi:thiol:disulfide interchange protein DsbD
MNRTAPLVAVLLAAFASVTFGVRPASAQSGRKLPVRFTAAVKPEAVRAGEAVTVTVKAEIDAGWHLYAPESASPKPNPATPSDITALGDWKAVGPTTDDAPPEKKFDKNFEAEVAFHEGEASLSRAFRVSEESPATPPGEVSVRYQVCDASVCLPPTTAKVPVALTVEAGEARAEYKAAAAPVASSAGDATGGLGGPWFFLAAAGAGLLALVTPCVFPLIPITLASFAKQADGDRKKLARLAVGYALGVAALYVAVGGFVSVVAGAAGANKLAANPWVNLFAFGVFVVFALSFFETIQLNLPMGLQGAVHGKARSKGGVLQLVLLGVVFVIASFTCTAPFVGTLLVATAGGELLRPLLGMAVFALAFTSPFLLFAAFPQTLTRMPKSGAWLARVKATLGFVELAAALKFLSNADMVWQWGLLPQPVLLAAWALLSALASLYLLGLLRFGVIAETEAPGARVSPLRGAFAGLFAGAALYCFWGLSGRPIHPIVETFLPPAGYGLASSGVGQAGGGHPGGMEWMTDYDAALARAKAENKPLFIDFTGYTCTNCRLNERAVFPDPSVKAELEKFVRVQLYLDAGPDSTKNQKLELTKFGDVAMPLYGVVDPTTGAVIGKTAGVQTIGGFRQFLQESHAKTPVTTPEAEAEAAALWAPYSEEALAAAKAAGKPVVIDFTAAWCVNCKQIEKEVFEQPAVADRLGREFVTLRADLTKWADPASVALQKKFGFAALPTIALLGPDGQEVKPLRITGRLPVAEFEKRLDALKAAGGGSPAQP